MTCKDCKYFNPNIHLKPEWVNQGLCEKRLTNGYAEYPTFDCEICGMFQPTHESVGNALDALDSWESVNK